MNEVLVVLVGPSGVGKSAIKRILLERFANIPAIASVSTTTRPPREGERDGVDYYFVSRELFRQKEERNDFLESAQYGLHRYGTDRHRLAEELTRSRLVIKDMDVQGCRQLIARTFNALFCAILPDQWSALEQRIQERPHSDEADIERRLAIAEIERTAILRGEFGEPILNVSDNIGSAVDSVRARILTRLY